jgi:hypothetical protein
MTYSFNPPVTGARDSVYSDYNKAKDLIDARNYSGAIALLTPVLSLERLNFYEREMVSLLLSASYLGLKDYITVGEYAEAATLFNGRYLTPPARTMTIRLRITADVMTGDYADAFSWYGTLKKTESVGPDDPVTKLIDIAKARLADPNPIHVSGRIPAIGYVNLWSHTLLRRNFSFPTVTGKLANFVLDCDQQSLQSVISTTAEWHVPKSWSRCSLRVRGDPGATFTLLEANE